MATKKKGFQVCICPLLSTSSHHIACLQQKALVSSEAFHSHPTHPLFYFLSHLLFLAAVPPLLPHSYLLIFYSLRESLKMKTIQKTPTHQQLLFSALSFRMQSRQQHRCRQAPVSSCLSGAQQPQSSLYGLRNARKVT